MTKIRRPAEPKYNTGGRYLNEYINFSNFFIVFRFNIKIRNISLTFLRALEIAELKEEDMPMV